MFYSKTNKFIIYDIVPELTVIKFLKLKLNTENCYLYAHKHLDLLQEYVTRKTKIELSNDMQRLKLASKINASNSKVKIMHNLLPSIIAILTVLSISAIRPLKNYQLKSLNYFIIIIAIASIIIAIYEFKNVVVGINDYMYEESFKILSTEINKKNSCERTMISET
jgi:ArsR family metal-binding transcriptional regulator